ncbi:MAG: hypothetical protein GVY26_01705 [Bacteroidetes bacterium]|jgi:hypothetical protein|nr:hypothetical protein [Bacteroidota bacterium]
MKYRRLTEAELDEVEPQFVRFLASNQITADDWEKLKAESPDKVERLIEIFSDIVFDKVLEDVNYLEFKTPHDLKAFHFLEDKAVMNGLKIEGETEVDLTEQMNPKQLSQQLQLTGAKLKLYTAEKEYKESRKMEIFNLMEGGALISRSGTLFKSLEKMK